MLSCTKVHSLCKIIVKKLKNLHKDVVCWMPSWGRMEKLGYKLRLLSEN